jgi:hypothetical protein
MSEWDTESEEEEDFDIVLPVFHELKSDEKASHAKPSELTPLVCENLLYSSTGIRQDEPTSPVPRKDCCVIC